MPIPSKSTYRPIAGDARYGRSAVTNGSRLLPGIDGRSPWVRRCRDVIAAHLCDLPDASVSERSIIRRASVMTTELERMEAQFATVGEADPAALDLYARVAGNLRRLLESVGLKRQARNIGPTLDDIKREHEESAQA
jgi:hypothetical protein